MDTTAKPEQKVEDAVKNLKIDPPSKTIRLNMSGPKDASQSDATSCISSADATSSIKDSELDQESSMSEQGMYYYGYYYPGYNGLVGEWDTQSYASGTDGMETQPPAIHADNGHVVYYLPGFQAGYAPYSSFVPGTMPNADSQYFAQQPYCPNQLSPQSVVNPGIFSQPIAYGPEIFPVFSWDPSVFFVDGLQGNTYNADPATKHSKSNISSQARNANYSKTFHASKAPEVKVSSPVTFETQTASIPNQSSKPGTKTGTTLLSKAYTPTNKSRVSTQGKSGILYTNSKGSVKESNQSWDENEKMKARTKINGLGDIDVLSEQNCGQRTSGTKTTNESDVKPTEFPSLDKNDNKSGLIATVSKDQYNRADFQTKYEHALFFVIKSYSEDDIHKSIKYNVWSSTPNGNKRLDNAFLTAQEKMMEKGTKCPVFLFFSVNASGQFCGLAEMTGRVDFSRNMDFWQQDKWNGFFPVKWHIIKDIPNPHFRHIILENNDNKPVTNSRDTQEVKFLQGTEMLNIFKSYSFKTSILDDFDFYESRQRAMQDKRNKLHLPNVVNILAGNNELSQAPKTSDSKPTVSDTVSPEFYSENPKEELQTLSSARD